MTHAPRHDRSRRPGLSLLEMTVALSAVAVFAAVAVPKFSDFGVGRRVEAASARLRADIERVRAEARATGVAAEVVFDIPNGSYTPGNCPPVLLNSTPYSAALTDLGSPTTLRFDAYGDPEGLTAPWQIGVTAGGITRTVTVDAVTGMTGEL